MRFGMQLFLSGSGQLFYITKRAMVKKDYKELDEAIKAKIQPYLYNQGDGAMVPIAQLACLRNRDRAARKQVKGKQPNKYLAIFTIFLFSSFRALKSWGRQRSTSSLKGASCWPSSRRVWIRRHVSADH